MEPDRSDITRLLQAWGAGDKAAAEELWPKLFAELKRIAHRQISGENAGHTLQSGALVNELYLRLTELGKHSVAEPGAILRHMCTHDASNPRRSRARPAH